MPCLLFFFLASLSSIRLRLTQRAARDTYFGSARSLAELEDRQRAWGRTAPSALQ